MVFEKFFEDKKTSKRHRIVGVILQDLLNFLTNLPQLLLFLYSKHKNVFERRYNSAAIAKDSMKLSLTILQSINKNVKLVRKGKSLLFYKDIKLNVEKFIDDEEYASQMFGIPKCCYKRYVEDEENRISKKYPKSFLPAIRYLRDLNLNRIKFDDFVKIGEDGGVTCNYGFIPCSPKCKKAKKIRRYYEKMVNQFNKTN